MRLTPTTRQDRRVPAIVYLLGAIGFLMGTSEMVVAGLLPQIAASTATSVSAASTLITFFAVGVIIGAPLSAVLVAVVSQRAVLIASLSAFALAHIAMSISSDFGLLLVARTTAGLMNGIYWGVASAVVVTLADTQVRSRALGILITGNTVAPLLGVPLGTLAGAGERWPLVFLTLGALSAGGCLLVIVSVPRSPRQTAGALAGLRHASGALRRPLLLLVFAAIALIQGGMAACYVYLPVIISELDDRVGTLTAVQVAFGLGAVFGSQLGGWLGDRRPWPTVFAAAAALTVCLFGVSRFAQSPAALVVLAGLIGTSTLATNPILMSFVARLSEPWHHVAVAFNPAAFNAGTAIGASAGAATFTATGTPSDVGATGALLAMLAFPALIVVAAALRRRRELPAPG